MKRKPVFYWHFVSWYCFSIGINIDFESPNIEIHLPFGFMRMGLQIIKYNKEMSFLDNYVLDIDKRLQGVEKYIAQEKVENKINEPPFQINKVKDDYNLIDECKHEFTYVKTNVMSLRKSVIYCNKCRMSYYVQRRDNKNANIT